MNAGLQGREQGHPSVLLLHRLRLGELPAAEEGALRRHLAGCEGCAARLDDQHRARAEFLAAPAPAWLADLPAGGGGGLAGWWLGWLAGGLAALRRGWALAVPGALAAALLIAYTGGLGGDPGGDPGSDPGSDPGGGAPGHARSKGGASLEAWVETGRTPRPLYGGEALRAGDRVQLRFDPGPHRFVTLAGRDGSGAVEIYGVIQAAGPGLQSAPFALTLDGSRGAQTFYAVLTEARPDSDALLGRLSSGSPTLETDTGMVGGGGEILALTVEKE